MPFAAGAYPIKFCLICKAFHSNTGPCPRSPITKLESDEIEDERVSGYDQMYRKRKETQ